eukprot:jgi/Chlat1/1454/Chrsp12S08682
MMDRGGAAAVGGMAKWFYCQLCQHPLDVSVQGDAAGLDKSTANAGWAASVMNSAMGASRLDHSFVVLPVKERGGQAPSPTSVAAASTPRPSAAPVAQPPAHLHSHPPSAVYPAHRNVEESFVVLPSSASIYRHERQEHSGAASTPRHGTAVQRNTHFNASIDAQINALARIFDMASTDTQVDQPLCLDCLKALGAELDAEFKEGLEEAKQYEDFLNKLRMQPEPGVSEEELKKDMRRAEEDEKKLLAKLAQADSEHAALQKQLADLDAQSKELDLLEERYWHDFNDFRLQLSDHQEERDGIIARMDVANAQLEVLRHTSVFNDAFYIWHQGEFGTINGFRLGRLPGAPVEWDELNAAWGQACLLLYTMAQTCKLNFSSYRILPLGSFPRIADSRHTYELFGPVNVFWRNRYDKAMVLFLACLKEFAEFANARDRARDPPPDKCFELPYKIEGDKVHGLTIKLSFNRDEKWTRALKYTLCNLKWALAWLTNNHNSPPTSSSPSSASPDQSTLTTMEGVQPR